jgi:hypothetical protein
MLMTLRIDRKPSYLPQRDIPVLPIAQANPKKIGSGTGVSDIGKSF